MSNTRRAASDLVAGTDRVIAVSHVSPIKAALARGRTTITRAGFAVDYFEARHADTLALVRGLKDGPIRLLVAAKIGTTRLIDNVGV